MRIRAVVFTLAAGVAGATPLVAQGDGCPETRFPPQLPPTNTLVDSAHAVADLAAFAGSKPMVFSLVFGKGDSVPKIRALDKNDAAAALALYNYVRHQPPTDLWAIRVRIAGGDTPTLTLERSHYCPPRPLSGDGRIDGRIASPTGAAQGPGSRTLGRMGPDATLGRARDVEYEALVTVDGHVIGARILRPSGNADVDADMALRVQQLRFRPALLDDDPVAALFRSGGQSPRP